MRVRISHATTHVRRISFLIALTSAGALGFIAASTQPTTVGLGGIVAFFGLLYLLVSSLFVCVASTIRREPPLTYRGVLKAAIAALAPVMLIGLSSTGSVSLLDVVLVAAFQVAAQFYVDRIA